MPDVLNTRETIMRIAQMLMERYWGPMYKAVKVNPGLLEGVPGFLLDPDEVIFYLGQTHLGIEYVGPERITKLPPSQSVLKTQWFDFTNRPDGLLNRIIGFDFADGLFPVPLPPVSTDLVLPTNAGFEKLRMLGWSWAAQNMLVGLNTGGIEAPEGQFTRIVNGRFFDADDSGLRTRHIKWLDLTPVKFDSANPDADCLDINVGVFDKLAEVDLRFPYPIPDDFKFQRLPRINRFIELLGDKQVTETKITGFLSEPDYSFILSMRFSATKIHSQRRCEWQSRSQSPIKPDFFVEGPDGFADIVEFKLPGLKGSAIVGKANRKTFSAEVTSYISQTRVYRDYFDDPRNREWVEKQHGFKVYKPKRYLVLGRRSDFSSEEWRALAADFTDLHILTYDDLIDGVVVQFYR